MQSKGNEPHFCVGKRAHVHKTGQGFSVWARMRGAYEGHGEGEVDDGEEVLLFTNSRTKQVESPGICKLMSLGVTMVTI